MSKTTHTTGTTDALRHALRLLILPFLLLLFLIYSAIPLSCCFAAETEAAARVNGVAITVADLNRAIDDSRTPGSFHGNAGKMEEYRKSTLDRLIDGTLLFQEAARRGLTIGEGDIDRIVKEVEGRFKEKTAFELALKSSGIGLKEYREQIRKNELIKKILRVEVEEKSSCSEQELVEYYSANKGKFLKPESFRIRHILLKVPPLATDQERTEIKDNGEALLKRMKGGEEVTGGDLGWVHEGGSDEPLLVEAASHLTVGETSGLIENIYGFHIVKLDDKKPAEQRSFAEVKDSLKKKLELKKSKDLSSALITPLREKAKIEIY